MNEKPRTIWITGASKGIGRALALLYAERGDHVAASARSAGELKALAEAASGLPGTIIACPVDVTEDMAMQDTARRIAGEMGPIDVAILNAGTHIPVTVEDFDAGAFEKLLQINVMGVVRGIAAVLPDMKDRGAGQVAIVASVAGYRGLPSASAYGASKAALINMAEALHVELEPFGVDIRVVNPGFVKTPLTDRNEFKMPFLMEVDDAAQRIIKGLEGGSFEITFPRRFTWWLKLLRCLPYFIYFSVTRRLRGTSKPAE